MCKSRTSVITSDQQCTSTLPLFPFRDCDTLAFMEGIPDNCGVENGNQAWSIQEENDWLRAVCLQPAPLTASLQVLCLGEAHIKQ
jgi:hypothetical protein